MEKIISGALMMALAIFLVLAGIALVLFVVLPGKTQPAYVTPQYYTCPNCQRRVDLPRFPPEREIMPTPNLRPQGSLTGDKGAKK